MTTVAPAPRTASRPLYTGYVVWLLTGISIVNYFDRQIVNILAEPIKRDLGLADWQLGALTGLAFAALYTLMGIPIALLADRSSRSRIITAALAFWSIFTAVCGLAQGFASLLLARLAVGLGEAGCSPPSHALISAYTTPADRPKAMGVYALGIPLGSLLALVGGGILAERLGWRAAFFVAGAPGLVLAVLAATTLRDPPRPLTAQKASLKETFHEIRGNGAFWWLSLGAASMGFVSYGQLAFLGSFFLRAHQQGLQSLAAQTSNALGFQLGPTAITGIGLGLIVGIAGVLGASLGGYLGDRVGRTRPRNLMWIPAVTAPLGLPLYVAAFLTPSTPWALVLLFVPKVIAGIWLAPVFATLQSVVSDQSRATASALSSSIVLLLGLGLGPIGIGILSDVLNHRGLGEAGGVRWALVCASGMCAVASLFFVLAARRMGTAKLS